jgi:hypothetical protein
MLHTRGLFKSKTDNKFISFTKKWGPVVGICASCTSIASLGLAVYVTLRSEQMQRLNEVKALENQKKNWWWDTGRSLSVPLVTHAAIEGAKNFDKVISITKYLATFFV